MNPIVKKYFSFKYRIAFISILGFLASCYLLFHHMKVKASIGLGDSFCSINNYINCDKIALSSYSEILGVPIAVFGISFYLVLFYFSFVAGKSKIFNIKLDALIYFLTALSAFYSLFLLLISLLKVKAACLFCYFLYLASFLIFYFARACYRNAKHFQNEADGKSFKEALNAKSLKLDFPFLPSSAVIFSSAVLPFILPTLISASLSPAAEYVDNGEVQLNSPSKILEDKYQNWLFAPENKFKFTFSNGPLPEDKLYSADFYKGSQNPIVQIVEFSDMECPFCRMSSPKLTKIVQKYPEAVQLVFKNFPLHSDCNSLIPEGGMHKNACKGARAIRCAGLISPEKFWQVHNVLYKDKDFDSSLLSKLESEFQKPENLTRFKVCYEGSYPAGVEEDVEEGRKFGVSSTPSVFLNGRLIKDLDESFLSYLIERQIKNSKN